MGEAVGAASGLDDGAVDFGAVRSEINGTRRALQKDADAMGVHLS